MVERLPLLEPHLEVQGAIKHNERDKAGRIHATRVALLLHVTTINRPLQHDCREVVDDVPNIC